MSNEHPFVLDLLAGWAHFVGNERHAEAYHDAVYEAYQKAGAALIREEENPESVDQWALLDELLREIRAKVGGKPESEMFIGPTHEQDEANLSELQALARELQLSGEALDAIITDYVPLGEQYDTEDKIEHLFERLGYEDAKKALIEEAARS